MTFKAEKNVFFYNLGVSLTYSQFLKKHYGENKCHFCICLALSIPFFIFLVTGVQNRKSVFLQSWCVLTLLLFFEETLSTKQTTFLYFSWREHTFLYFLGQWRSKQKKSVFLQSWCVLTLLLIFEATSSRKQMSFLYFSWREHTFL